MAIVKALDQDAATKSFIKQLRKTLRSHNRDIVFACGGVIPVVTVGASASQTAAPDAAGASSSQAAALDAVDASSSQAAAPNAADASSSQAAAPDVAGASPSQEAAPDATLGSDSGSDSGSDDSSANVSDAGAPGGSSAPVTVRWDTSADRSTAWASKITFPLEPMTSGHLPQLLHDMQPATFGLKGKDVLDESYRKASKLDTTQFCSTFNPYELGIVDAVAQILLPDTQGNDAKKYVRAELYKLNIYSGPSGKFKAHVDTPRSVDQFGSLVVCLPLAHEGGALEVRHAGKTQTFDWGSNLQVKPNIIQWAAFYSDCEHEVLEVTAGHRLTLTYNLYATRGNGSLAGHCPAVDPAKLPLYDILGGMLADPSFMPKGGALGFYSTHAYPFTHELSELPSTLKGLDMSVWHVLEALDCDVSLLSVADAPINENQEDYVELERWSDREERDEDDKKDEDRDEKDNDNKEHSGGEETEDEEEEDVELDTGYATENEAEVRAMLENYGGSYLNYSDVCWLNEAKYEELQLAYTAYGNEGSLGTVYSHCAIVAEVPTLEARTKANLVVEPAGNDKEVGNSLSVGLAKQPLYNIEDWLYSPNGAMGWLDGKFILVIPIRGTLSQGVVDGTQPPPSSSFAPYKLRGDEIFPIDEGTAERISNGNSERDEDDEQDDMKALHEPHIGRDAYARETKYMVSTLPKIDPSSDIHYVKRVGTVHEVANLMAVRAFERTVDLLGRSGPRHIVFQRHGKSLGDYMPELKRAVDSDIEKHNLIVGCAKALLELHDCGIVHKDVTTYNFLYDGSTVKICDLECKFTSTHILPPEFMAQASEHTKPSDVVAFPWNFATDVFAFSMIIWSLFFCNGPRPYTTLKSPGPYTQIFESCRLEEPHKRPSMVEVVNALVSMSAGGDGGGTFSQKEEDGEEKREDASRQESGSAKE